MLRNPQAVNGARISLGPPCQKKISNYIYETQGILGKGSFSTVHRGVNINESVAVKVIRLSSLTCNKLQDLLQQEITILCSMSHHNIIRCHEVLKSANNCYIITELCEQGNLETFLKQKKRLSEEELWPYVRDIYEGLRYLAKEGIVHRDLKISNLFMKNGVVKIADFGFAIRTRYNFYDLSIGSPLYMAPEGYIEKRYGPKTDVWAFGIIVFELLHGRTPFANSISDEDLKQKMRKGINSGFFRVGLSSEAKDLINRCLTVEQSVRISLQQIQHLPFFLKNKRNAAMQAYSLIRFYSSIPMVAQSYQKQELLKQNQLIKDDNDLSAQARKCLNSTKIIKIEPSVPSRQKNIQEESVTSASSNAQQSFTDNNFIKGKISFNEALGFIHYCRIGFQLLKLMSNELIKGVIKQIIVSILQDLFNKIVTKSVAQSKKEKQKKLKVVVRQYIEKYKDYTVKMTPQLQEVDFEESRKLLSKILNHLQQKQLKIEEEVYEMHLLLLFIGFSHKFCRDTLTQDYSCFASENILQQCLSDKERYSFLENYHQVKQKLVYLKDKN